MRIGQIPISSIKVNHKYRGAFPKLVLALKELFLSPEYNDRIFKILEEKIVSGKKKTGRPGMDLWVLFVMAQTRLCLNISYDELYRMANCDRMFREVMGVESEDGFERMEFEYQNILDNVSLLDDETVLELNGVVVDMGHGVFKKKGAEALRLKTDSFVVESNVHFPTDYNLLWDSGRKCMDVLGKFIRKYDGITGWRKLGFWHRSLKSGMRILGQAGKSGGKGKEERVLKAAANYLHAARLFLDKLTREKPGLPLTDMSDCVLLMELDYYQSMLEKHVGLVERRIIRGEIIPHDEKLFSIFEPYTEWITKGKQNPNVELGKNLQVTTDQFHLIIDYRIMEHEVDKSCAIPLADRVLPKFKVETWSFDKGFYSRDNKELLSLFIPCLIMPKKGKLNQMEKEQEGGKTFRKLRNRHSAIESNINELEHRGLDRCPDKSYPHFKRYVGLGVCAYNLRRIGAELMRQAIKAGLKRAA